MNLQELNSALPKPWLNINSNSVNTKTLGLVEQSSVATPPIGSINLYTDLSGALSSIDSSSVVKIYTTSSEFSNVLLQQGPTVTGNLIKYVDNVSLNVQDSGLLTADIFLKNGNIPMTGDLNMNVHEIKGLVAIRPNDSNFVAGNTTSLGLGATGNVLIGDFTTSTGSNCIGIGLQCIVRNLAVVIGKEAIGGVLSTIIGYRSSNGSNTDTIIIGHDNVSSGGANADIFGVNRTNNQANSLLLGNGSYVNIRANTTCDLGTVIVPFNSIYANGNLVSAGSSKSIDNIVSTASTGVSGNVTTFLAGKVVQDSGIALSSLATTASLATYVQGPASAISTNLASYNGITGKLIQDSGLLTANVFLRTGAIAMTGALNMNANNITNVGIITTNTATVNVGNTNTTSNVGDIYVGSNNTAGGILGGISIIYGNSNNIIGSPNGQSIVYGNNNIDSNNAGGAFIYGFGNTNGTGSRNILIGRNLTIPNGVNDSFVIGFNITNSISNSLLTGNLSNIRPNNNNVCNLGILSTNQFNNIFVQNIDTSGSLGIGNASSSGITLGRSGITTNVNSDLICNSSSIFATTVSIGTWYCTTTYNPSFTAGVTRLTPPATITTGILTNFTHSLGVLTYTGTRTRTFKVVYNITFTSGPNGSNMIFFISKNASVTIGTQTQQRMQIGFSNNVMQMCVQVEDLINLATNDTIQLAGQCAQTTGAVGYNYISCNVFNLNN